MVIQDVDSYEADKHTLAMLQLAALGRKAVENGKFNPARKAFEDIRNDAKSGVAEYDTLRRSCAKEERKANT